MEGSFNAARGFVGGAAVNEKFSPKNFRCFNAARGFVGGAALFLVLYHHQQLVSMPHAALWVVQHFVEYSEHKISAVSMPHAALWVVQLKDVRPADVDFDVSMPHAALWVVQPLSGTIGNFKEARFQCRTRLCGWCSNGGSFAVQHCRWFQCRTRLCGWCSRMNSTAVDVMATFQCRTRLCGWCSLVTVSHSASTSLVSMPHAALWVVQHCHREGLRRPYVFQCRTRLCGWCSAAGCCSSLCSRSFNAARGFVGGAAIPLLGGLYYQYSFNAARGFVGGAASPHIR